MAYVTHRGAVRAENQDALYPASSVKTGDMAASETLSLSGYPCCVVVIDGMGGYEGGALAARVMAEAFAAAVERHAFGENLSLVADEAALRGIMESTGEQMASLAAEQPRLSEMGATFAGLVIRENVTVAFNCGDCRAYRISRGALERVTNDHSLVQALRESGAISEEEMRTHPRKNIVTSAVSANMTERPEIYVRGLSRVEDDEYFLCSDGVWEALPADTLAALLSGPYPDAADALFEALLDAGCHDNISFIWAKS
jgi:protein phosphatase